MGLRSKSPWKKNIKILVVPKHFIAGRDVVPSLFQSSMENFQPRGVVGLAFEVGQQQAIHPRDVEEKVHLPLISRTIGSFWSKGTMACPYRCEGGQPSKTPWGVNVKEVLKCVRHFRAGLGYHVIYHMFVKMLVFLGSLFFINQQVEKRTSIKRALAPKMGKV